jgi:fibronectin type 3 domain-containing protein
MVASFKRTFSSFAALCLAGATLMLAACGGSPGVSSRVVSGVASVGATLAGQVELKDASGSAVKTAVIGADGSYAIDVTGLKGPFMLQAKGSAGGVTYKLNSFAAGTGTANVNPLTHVIVASAAGADDPYEKADAATVAKIREQLPDATKILLAQLQPLLKKYNADQADPLTGHYAADHTGLDGLFDNVRITVASGIITVTNAKTGSVIFTASIFDLKNGHFNNDSDQLPPTPAVPAVPAAVTATGGANQVFLAWGAVPNATGYYIYWSTQSGVTSQTGTKVPVNANSFVQSGLSPATTYYYVVSAVNSAGEGGVSAEASATTASAPVATAPAAPGGVTATAGTKQVTVAWNAVAGATSYNIYWATTAGVTPLNGTLVAGASSPSVVKSLADSTTYYFVVTAVSAAGESSPSVQVVAATPAPTPAPTAPAAPTGLTAVGGTSQATLSWSQVPGAVSYNLYWSTTPGVTTATGTRVPAASSPYVLTALAGGTTYYFVVTAVNAVGESAASAQASAATSAPPLTLPATPTGVSASGGDKQVTVSWPAVPGATSYNLYWSTTSGVGTGTGTKVSGAVSPFVQSGLAAGTSYYYIVTAVNSAGESAPSAQVTAATAAPAPVPPVAPAGVSATGGTSQATVSWAAVPGATSYNLYYSTTSGVTTVTGTKVAGVSSPSIVSGLAASTTYYFVVTAVNAAGEGATSAQATATTATPAPAFDGAAYYTANCAGCHGPLGASDKQGATSASISAGITRIRSMNQFSILTQAQIDAIAAALK